MAAIREYMVAPVEPRVRMPKSLDAAEAAPLMCTGITTFNALRHSDALPSYLVALQGIGGLGHLGIQFAQRLGYKVGAIEHGPENSVLARSSERAYTLIAQQKTKPQSYRNSRRPPFLPPRPQLESNVLDGPRRQRHHGRCRRPEPIEVSPAQLIFGRKNIRGWPSAIPTES